MNDFLVFIEYVIGYLSIGSIFSGLCNRFGLMRKTCGFGEGGEIFAPIVVWPFFLVIFIIIAFFYPFITIAERIATKKEPGENPRG